MSELKDILKGVDFKRDDMGGVTSENMKKALNGFRRKYFAIFVVLFVVLVVVVALGTVGVAFYIREPLQIAAVGTGLGITVGGTITVMRGVWKEWSQAELITILIEDAPEDSVRKLLDTLISKL